MYGAIDTRQRLEQIVLVEIDEKQAYWIVVEILSWRSLTQKEGEVKKRRR